MKWLREVVSRKQVEVCEYKYTVTLTEDEIKIIMACVGLYGVGSETLERRFQKLLEGK